MPVLSDDISVGPEARVVVNGLPWAIIEGSYRDFTEEVVVTDSEDDAAGDAYQRRRHGLQDFELSASMQFDVTVGITFDITLLPIPKQTAAVRFHPNKGGPDFYETLTFRVFDCSGNFAVRGSQPVIERFSGKTDGTFGRFVDGVEI